MSYVVHAATRICSLVRAPLIGVPTFISGTEDDWPLWPIEVVDGVPFMVVQGYTIGGLPESDESYLHYCEVNCDWTDVKYSVKTVQQKQNALAKFTSSDKWHRVNTGHASQMGITFKDFLFRQIQ